MKLSVKILQVFCVDNFYFRLIMMEKAVVAQYLFYIIHKKYFLFIYFIQQYEDFIKYFFKCLVIRYIFSTFAISFDSLLFNKLIK